MRQRTFERSWTDECGDSCDAYKQENTRPITTGTNVIFECARTERRDTVLVHWSWEGNVETVLIILLERISGCIVESSRRMSLCLTTRDETVGARIEFDDPARPHAFDDAYTSESQCGACLLTTLRVIVDGRRVCDSCSVLSYFLVTHGRVPRIDEHVAKEAFVSSTRFLVCVTVMFQNPADGSCADRAHGTNGTI